jgi:hypothetical protein
MAAKAATVWGATTVVEEIAVQQRAGAKRFTSLVQLLENGKGERFVRFAYTTDGVVRRGPVTLRAADLGKLRDALGKSPGLAEALGMGTGRGEG